MQREVCHSFTAKIKQTNVKNKQTWPKKWKMLSLMERSSRMRECVKYVNIWLEKYFVHGVSDVKYTSPDGKLWHNWSQICLDDVSIFSSECLDLTHKSKAEVKKLTEWSWLGDFVYLRIKVNRINGKEWFWARHDVSNKNKMGIIDDLPNNSAKRR